MKQLLISGLILLTFTAVGQQRDQIQPANDNFNSKTSVDLTDLNELPKTITCQDTVRYPQFKEQRVGASTFYSFELWTDDSEEVSQKFELGGSNLDVSSVEFFGRMSPANHTSNGGAGTISVEAAIYTVDANNDPLTLLSSTTVAISDTVWGYRYLDLPSPLTVNADYAVVIRPTSPGAIVQFYLNDIVTGQAYDEDLSRITSTYYDGSNGNWVSLPALSGSSQWNGPVIDCEALIAPIVSYTVDPNFTINPNPVCQDDQVTFTNTSASQDIIENRMYTYDVFQTYFGLSTADSTYIYQFGDGSPLGVSENTTHTYTTSGTYNVIQLNLGGVFRGCIDDVTIPITVDPLDDASFSYSSTEFCSDGANETPTTATTGSFTALPAGLVFANASTGEINISASTPGTYDITYTTNGTCPNSSTSTITISEPATAGFSYSQASYCGDAGTISPTLDAGATAGTFTATPTGGLSITGATGDIDVNASAAGNYTVTNTIAAANGCPAQTATFNIEIIALDDASFTYSSTTLCSGGTNEVPTINATGTFTSSPAGLIFADASTGEIDMTSSADGTYNVTFTTNGTCPDASTQSITITSSPDATFSYSATEFCAEVGTEAPSFPAGASAGAFTSTPAGLSISGSNGIIILDASTPGTYDVTNTIAASGSCPQTSHIETVTINALPTVDAGVDQEVCEGDQVTLTATGADVYTWDNGASQGVPFTPTVGVTTYTVIGENTATGCQNTDQVNVTVNENPTVDAGVDQEVCAGEEVTLTATASAGTVSWDNGVMDGTPFTPVATTTYTVTADNNGCTSTDAVVVTVNDLPLVDAGTNETACVNHDPITLSGSPAGGTYSGTGVTGNEFDPSVGAGTYTVTYTYVDGNGCEASNDLTITVDGCASINENNLNESITIMPNPATDYIDVVIGGSTVINAIKLMSAEGRIVEFNTTTLDAKTTRINLKNVSKGTYLIKMNTSNGQVIKRVVVH